ncbi:MAG: Fis family transcriptional regulator [Desulfobacteraceae bacterium 4572_123]|nr:MAG: Fis family transcriptional regulator [Desulfobacteraceae bacterium 4572_123]
MNQPRHHFEKSYHIILDSIEEGVFTVDLDWRITSFNRAAEKITGVARQEAIGAPCSKVFNASVCKTNCVLRKVIKSNTPIMNMPINITRADGKRTPISVNGAILMDHRGCMIGGVETFRDLTVVNKLRQQLGRQHFFENMVSKNQKMQRLFSALPQIAESNCTVLIEGATGTGKELLARAIHYNSPKKKGPFVAVNCGALPETLIESELFGYKTGAFTDAKKDKPGRFARAQDGTIFLDEIGDISQASQIRLLRVLEEKAYEPLGSVKTASTNARVVVATRRKLAEMVEENSFREDLYFRINVIKLTLPTLSERKEDIPLLVQYFIERFNNEKEKKILGLTQNAMAVLTLHDWPGNIRELENAIEHAFVLCNGELIHLCHLPDELWPKNDVALIKTRLTLREIEKRAIIQALAKNNWKKASTARELGVHKNTLRRKIIRHGIEMT